jgi:hypothetical protein
VLPLPIGFDFAGMLQKGHCSPADFHHELAKWIPNLNQYKQISDLIVTDTRLKDQLLTLAMRREEEQNDPFRTRDQRRDQGQVQQKTGGSEDLAKESAAVKQGTNSTVKLNQRQMTSHGENVRPIVTKSFTQHAQTNALPVLFMTTNNDSDRDLDDMPCISAVEDFSDFSDTDAAVLGFGFVKNVKTEARQF